MAWTADELLEDQQQEEEEEQEEESEPEHPKNLPLDWDGKMTDSLSPSLVKYLSLISPPYSPFPTGCTSYMVSISPIPVR